MGLDIIPVCLVCLALLSTALGIGSIFLLGFVLLKQSIRRKISNFFHCLSLTFKQLIDSINIFISKVKQHGFLKKEDNINVSAATIPVVGNISTVSMKDAATSITVDKCEQADMTAQEDYESDTDSLRSYLPKNINLKKPNVIVQRAKVTKLNNKVRLTKNPASIGKKKRKQRLSRKPYRVTVVAELSPELLENISTVKAGEANDR